MRILTEVVSIFLATTMSGCYGCITAPDPRPVSACTLQDPPPDVNLTAIYEIIFACSMDTSLSGHLIDCPLVNVTNGTDASLNLTALLAPAPDVMTDCGTCFDDVYLDWSSVHVGTACVDPVTAGPAGSFEFCAPYAYPGRSAFASCYGSSTDLLTGTESTMCNTSLLQTADQYNIPFGPMLMAAVFGLVNSTSGDDEILTTVQDTIQYSLGIAPEASPFTVLVNGLPCRSCFADLVRTMAAMKENDQFNLTACFEPSEAVGC